MERIDHLLPWSTLGSEKRLSVFRFGCGARKVYISPACTPTSCRACAPPGS